MIRLTVVYFALLLLPTCAFGQEWEPFTPIYEIGAVPQIAADETGGLWFFGSSGEFYRLAPGESRVEIAGVPGGNVLSLCTRTGHLLAIIKRPSGTFLERSTDSGASWMTVDLTLPSGERASPRRILIDSDGRRYIACHYGHLFQEILGTQGSEWQFYTQKPYLNNDSLTEIFSIAGSDGSLVISIVDMTLRRGGKTNDILAEGPRGEWRSISPTDNTVANWSVARTLAGEILVTTALGTLHPPLTTVYISSDSGRSWDTLDVGAIVQAPGGRSPMATSRSGSLAYLTGGGIQYSNEGGRGFQKIEAAGNGYLALGADDRLRAHMFVGEEGHYALYEENLNRTTMVKRLETPVLIREDTMTTDGHIRKIIDHPRTDSHRWYAVANRKTIFERTSTRQNWRPMPSIPTDSVTTIFWRGNDLYVGGTDGLFRRDVGATGGWEQLFVDSVANAIIGYGEIVVNDAGSGVLNYHLLLDGKVVSPPAESPASDPYVRLIGRGPDGSIAILSERGLSLLPTLTDRWRTILLPIPANQVDHVEIASDQLIVFSDGANVWSSIDRGASWNRSLLEDGPVIELTRGIVLHYHNNRQLRYPRFVALTPSGIWNSDDSGRSWTSIVNNLPTSGGMSAFVFEANGLTSLVAVDDHGIFTASKRSFSSVESGRGEEVDLKVSLRDRVFYVVAPGADLNVQAYDVNGRRIDSRVETAAGTMEAHGTWLVPTDVHGALLLRVRSSEGEWVVKVVL